MSASEMCVPTHQGLVTQALAHGTQRTDDARELPVDPGLATLFFGAPGPGAFQSGEQGGIQQAIAQRFPGSNLGAFAATFGQQAADG